MTYNLADLFESIADAIPDREALISGEHRYTYGQLDEAANRLANFLKDRGVKTGDHVGLHLYNGHEFVIGMLAVFKLRAVHINLNYRYVAAELRYLCENADLVAVLTQTEFADILADATTGNELLKTVIYVGEDPATSISKHGGIAFEGALAEGSPARDFEARTGKEIYIIYTGGTTGMPKGVMWQHEDVFFAGLQGGRPGGEPVDSPEEVPEYVEDPDNALNMLPAAPFIHGAAQWGFWIALWTGGKTVLQPGKSFDAKRICELIEEENLSTLTVVGDAMALPIAECLEAGDYNVESILAIASAGAVLSGAVRDRLAKEVPDALVLNNFGATETGHQGSAYPGFESGQEGRPSFFMDETNTVLDEDTGEQIVPGSGKIGKLARGGRLPQGYYKDPVKTEERFKTIKGKRWVIPGDYGTIEEDGRITVYGRGSYCINTGGEKVFPEEVEEALKAHPDVFDVLVVGVKDDRWMQRVAAVVQPRGDARPTLEELQTHCRDHVAGYKVPRQLHLVEQVQRAPSGKPDYPWALTIAEA